MIKFDFSPKESQLFEIFISLPDEDVRELQMADPDDPYGVLVAAVDESFVSCVVLVDGAPAGVFGLVEADSAIGLPWGFFHGLMMTRMLTFMRYSRRFLKIWQDAYPVLFGRVGSWNHQSIRYLRALGFSVSTPDSLGYEGPLSFFRRKEPHV